jgi:hypothetical protein
MKSVKVGILSMMAVFSTLAVSGAYAEVPPDKPHGIQGSGIVANGISGGGRVLPMCFVVPFAGPLCLLSSSK